MVWMEERGARDRALEDSVQQAEQSGLRADGACRLRDYLSRRVDAFRRAWRGDPQARVEPMRVHFKPQAQAVKARPRRYDPVKTGWLASCIAALGEFGLLVRNIQAVWASPAMAGPKRHFSFGQRLPGGELAGGAISGSDAKPGRHAGVVRAKCFGKLDLLQGYWQTPLAPEAQEVCTIVTADGLFTPIRVP